MSDGVPGPPSGHSGFAPSPGGLGHSASVPNAKLHELLAPGQIPCRSCPSKFPFPATHIASAERINDLPRVDWPVCKEHMMWAMVAGWFPIRDVTEADFASAIEARRVETEGLDAKHESAVPKADAQKEM